MLSVGMAYAEPVARFPDPPDVDRAPAASPSSPLPAPVVATAPRSTTGPRATPGEFRTREATPSPAPEREAGAQVLAERGRELERAGQVMEAIGAYTDSIALDPNDGATLLALGRLRERLGDTSEALLLFSAATRYPEFAGDAFAERARLLESIGHDADAVRDLEMAAALGPDDGARVQELASWYVARRAWLPALALFRRTVAAASGTDLERRARLQTRALSVLAGNSGSRRSRP